jgi:hypothetical protein
VRRKLGLVFVIVVVVVVVTRKTSDFAFVAFEKRERGFVLALSVLCC